MNPQPDTTRTTAILIAIIIALALLFCWCDDPASAQSPNSLDISLTRTLLTATRSYRARRAAALIPLTATDSHTEGGAPCP